MKTPLVEYGVNVATADEIAEYLQKSDADFVPPLSGRVEICDYARKIANHATRFEAWSAGTLIGLVAAYNNDFEARIAHITSVSVIREWTGKGIASRLVAQCIEHAEASGMRLITLEVARDNGPAIKLYEKYGFTANDEQKPMAKMELHLNDEE